MLRLRSWMFVPGNSEKMIGKALGLELDVAMLDLEDGVVPSLKADARRVTSAALGSPRANPLPMRYVRVNSASSGLIDDDLQSVVVAGLDGIVLPKVESVAEVTSVAERLEALERSRGLEVGSVKMMLAIETPGAVLIAPALATAAPRVSGLMFGAEDFSREINLPTVRTGHARDFIFARSMIVMAAAAAGKLSVDGVWPDLTDEEGLRADALLGRDLGFSGKSMIHPGQVRPVNEIFSPTAKDIEYATALVKDFEKATEAGLGSISFGGQLVDRPIYERALSTLRNA
ncbi:MAG: CoA ester lyase [Rhizobiaceae bacterium]|nr:CoA ester lyase [Rhizobiaceae bacterium]